jgi:hypothetical protein
MNKKTQWTVPLLIFITILVSYGYFIHFIGMESWNVSSRLDLVYSLGEYGSFRIDSYHKNTGDKVYYDGHYYSDKAPGPSLAAVPAYILLRRLGVDSEKYMRYSLTLLIVGIPSALGAVLLYWITGIFKDITIRSRVMVALIYALGTLAFPFATVFYGHQLTASASIAAFFILLMMKEERWKESSLLLILSGFLAGYAFISDYPAGISMVLLAVYALFVLKKKIGIISWLIGVSIPIAFILYYNYTCFGSPTVSSYSLHQTYSHSKGLLGIAWPNLDALWGITFSSYRGIFYQSPVLLLAIPGFYLLYRCRENRAEFALSLMIVLGFFFFNSGYAYWDGVGSVGARFLIPAIPFLILPLARSVKRWPIQVTLLGILSIIIMLIITATEPRAEWKVRSPLFYFSIFLFLKGYLAENLGMIFGLKGISSIIPLLVFLGVVFMALRVATRGSYRSKIRGKQILPATGLLGMVLLWLVVGGWEEPCLREFDKAESLFRYYRGRGRIQWLEVEGYYKSSIDSDPGFLDPYMRLAEIARMRGHHRVALAYYQRLSDLNPGLVIFHQEMALVYDLMGKTNEAERELLLTIELSPNDPALRNQLGAFYLEKGRRKEAIAQWEESLRINPGDKKIQIRIDEAREER